jgi:hypothetical protein
VTKGFIRYEVKNGIEYASVYKAKRLADGTKTNDVQWLGRVIDKQNGVYRNKEKGTFTFSLETGVTEIQSSKREKLILDFGDSFILNEVMVQSGFSTLLKNVYGEMSDTLLSLLFYRSLQSGANCYAQTWWEGSYARILFPKANTASQRISETLAELGDEWLQRTFFKNYLQYISTRCGGGVLIDSTGLPNDCDSPLTAVNNHNGQVSNETRLVLVIERKSGLPLYFRYASGNIVDVSTLEATLAEVRAYGVDITHAIIDAGYYSDKNIKAMRAGGVSFLMRMPTNRKLYKELIAFHASGLEDAKYLVKYRERFVYIKRVEIDLFGAKGYAFIALDVDRKHDEMKKYMHDNYDNLDVSFDEMNAVMHAKGLFVLISSGYIEVYEVLPLYYQRQVIEQVFDIGKNNVDLLPLRVHGIDAFRGHLLLSFLSVVAYILVNNMLKHSDFCALGVYRNLRNLKCKVFDDSIIVHEPNKKMISIVNHLKLKLPSVIPFNW